MGFGAERSNLMNEEPMSMPTQSTQSTSKPSSAEEETKDEPKSAAQKAKNQFLEEISKISDASASNMIITENEFTAEQMHFTVTNPVLVNKIMKYTVVGQDSDGRFETQRRFNEFFTLRKVLTERWPGCYVPCIPEKKTLSVDVGKSDPRQWKVAGNTDDEFVEERRTLLERFLRELAKFDFIIESKEFKIFSRGQGDVDEQLSKLPKQTPLAILQKYRLSFKIDEDQDSSEMKRYRDKIESFSRFITKAIVQVEVRISNAPINDIFSAKKRT